MTTLRFCIHDTLGSRLIHWWTRGFAHVEIVTGETVLGAQFFGGVEERKPAKYIKRVDIEIPFDIEEAARKYIGWRYNWKALVAFFFRFRWRSPRHLYCSQFVAVACRDVGHPILPKDQEDLADPQTFYDAVTAFLNGMSFVQ